MAAAAAPEGTADVSGSSEASGHGLLVAEEDLVFWLVRLEVEIPCVVGHLSGGLAGAYSGFAHRLLDEHQQFSGTVTEESVEVVRVQQSWIHVVGT
jgi:hypothetical protein